MNKEIVITGLGIVSPLGNDPKEVFSSLVQGKSGVENILRFDTEAFNVKFGGEVRNFDHSEYFEDKDARKTSRYVQYAVYAGMKAFEMSGLDNQAIDTTRAGIVIGSGMGGINCFTENAINLHTKGPRRVSPFFVPQAITNMATGTLAIRLGWQGPNWSVTSACATGNHAIMDAADQILLGRADVMICGGSEESICPISMAGFASMKALSTRNDTPQKASRPFDSDRDGFVMGEGSGVLVLESREHAEARGSKILATLKGYGASCDAYHMSAPLETGNGVALAIEKAIDSAKVSKKDIKIINCHATSTPLGDIAEVQAVKKVFGSEVKNICFQATKSMLGHTLGAAASIEAVVSILSLSEGVLHPTLNVENQDPRCDIDCVPNQSKPTDSEFALSNSFGFGGHNSSVLFQKGEKL